MARSVRLPAAGPLGLSLEGPVQPRDSATAVVEGEAQVGAPGAGVFPGEEVTAVVVGGDVDVVEPAGLGAGHEGTDALVGGVDAGRVLVGDEGEAARGLHGPGGGV